jgi:hypothetical protein
MGRVKSRLSDLLTSFTSLTRSRLALGCETFFTRFNITLTNRHAPMHSYTRGHGTRPPNPRCGLTSSYGHQELAATRRGLQRLLGEVGIIPRLVELDSPRARGQAVRRRAGRRPLVPG